MPPVTASRTTPEAAFDVKGAVHLRHSKHLAPEDGIRLLVTVPEALDDRALHVDRLFGELRGKGVEHAGLGVGQRALADSEHQAPGEVLELPVHHLDDESGASVGSLFRRHLALQGRLAGRGRGGAAEPLGLHRRLERPAPVDAGDEHPRQPPAEGLGVIVLDGDAVDLELAHESCLDFRRATVEFLS